MVRFDGSTFGSTIEPGKIYYFKSDQLTSTDLPHYFIVVATPTNDLIIFTCCTSQFEKRKRFLELTQIPFSTLVWIKPNENNGLKKDSYVDCNNCFRYSFEELIEMYNNCKVEFVGCLSDSKLEEIKQGIIESPLIVNEIKLLI